MLEDPLEVRMQPVALARKSLSDYASVTSPDVIGELRELAWPLRGARVAHVSATAHGGGVAEILHTLVPLMRDVGLHTEWFTIQGPESFFTVTKRLHNGLQGKPVAITEAMRTNYMLTNVRNAATFQDDFDFVVVHDPQPAALRSLVQGNGVWTWRCHIDLTDAQPDVWDFLRGFVEAYDAAIFTLPDFVKGDLRIRKVAIIPPAIDPLSQKNCSLPADQVTTLVAMAGVDPLRPALLQVSRFDPWKDPLGVIDIFRAVRTEVPGLQLVMLGGMAGDDPEGWTVLQQASIYAGGDPDIHLLTNSGGNIEVNAFQRFATVVLQRSVREGFGLTVTEGLWKERPVVASDVGGIPLQIEHGVSGYLATSTDQFVERSLTIIQDPDVAKQLGRNGREAVRRNFLCTSNLRHYLHLFSQLAAGRSTQWPNAPHDSLTETSP